MRPGKIDKSELDQLSLDDSGGEDYNGGGQVVDDAMQSAPSPSHLPPINLRGEKARESMTVSKQLIGPYAIGEMIGKGGFACVFKGLNTMTGDFVAIKRLEKSKISREQYSSVMTELELLERLNHENIVRVLGKDENDTHIFLFLEFMENGSLSTILNNFGTFPEALIGTYIEHVLNGLVYLHSENVIHRDIKAANILINKIGDAKLADFNVAAQLGESDKRYSVVGTPYWMAPEVIDISGHCTASDIWSVGCTIIELLTGMPPYFNHNPMSAMFRIVQDDRPPFPKGISDELSSFLTRCFTKSVDERASAKDLLNHDWIVKHRAAQQQLIMQGSRASLLTHTNSRSTINIMDHISKTLHQFNSEKKTDSDEDGDSSVANSEDDDSRTNTIVAGNKQQHQQMMQQQQMLHETSSEIKRVSDENEQLKKRIEKMESEHREQLQEADKKYKEILLSSMHYIYIVDSSINISATGQIKLQNISDEVTHLRNIMRDQIETEYFHAFPDRNMVPRFIERRLTRDTLIHLPKKSIETQKKREKEEKKKQEKREKLEKEKEKKEKIERKKLDSSNNQTTNNTSSNSLPPMAPPPMVKQPFIGRRTPSKSQLITNEIASAINNQTFKLNSVNNNNNNSNNNGNSSNNSPPLPLPINKK